MLVTFIRLGFFLIFSCATSHATDPNHINTTNTKARAYLDDLCALYPETGSFLGLREYDDKIGFVAINQDEKDLILNQKHKTDIEIELARLKTLGYGDKPEDMPLVLHEKHAELTYFLRKLQANIDIVTLNNQYGRLSVPNSYWNHMFDAFNPILIIIMNTFLGMNHTTLDQQASALRRFELYMTGDASNPPFIEGVIGYLRTKIQSFNERGTPILYPPRQAIEGLIQQHDGFLIKIAGPIALLGFIDGLRWSNAFRKQSNLYIEFLKTDILPHCPEEQVLPADLLKACLALQCIDEDISVVRERAYDDFCKTQEIFDQLIRKSDPDETKTTMERFNVMKNRNPIKNIADYCHTVVIPQLDDTIQNAFNLPEAPMQTNISGLLEGALFPAHRCTPPAIFGDRPPEVVLNDKTNFYSDEFCIHALLAHEGRPGHWLHFSRMADKEMNLLRTLAFYNNTTIEGWACYAGDLVLGHHSDPNKKLGALYLQHTLSIAYHCADLLMGKTTGTVLIPVFMSQSGFTEKEAAQRIQRYRGFLGYGQSLAYFHGQWQFYKLLNTARQKMGNQFKLPQYHDIVLSYGSLPVDLSSPLILRRLSGEIEGIDPLSSTRTSSSSTSLYS